MSGNIRQFPGKSGKRLETPGGPPDPPDMDARVGQLEADIRDVKATLGRLEPAINRMDDRLRGLQTDVAELKGRVSQLPTTVQIIGFVVAVLIAGGVLKHFLG